MKLKGFTLAEVLITMTLIGIVASLTLPALVTDVQRQQVGPALMRAYAALETAHALLINENDWYTFKSCCNDANHTYAACFTGFVLPKLSAVEIDRDKDYVNFSGTAETLPDKGYQTSNGFVYYLLADEADAAIIYIDVNGNMKGPNTLGKDLFIFDIDKNDGKVYAKGSKINAVSSGDWTTTCPESGPTDGGGTCAGAIIDNGGKVPYKF